MFKTVIKIEIFDVKFWKDCRLILKFLFLGFTIFNFDLILNILKSLHNLTSLVFAMFYLFLHITLFGLSAQLQNLSLFDLKIVYSYVVKIADFEPDLVLWNRGLVLEIFAFYHILENAFRRPGRLGHVHLGQKFFVHTFEGFEGV